MEEGNKREKMTFGKSEPKIKRGRPVENELPEQIPDTAENIARACMQEAPKQKWRYMKKSK